MIADGFGEFGMALSPSRHLRIGRTRAGLAEGEEDRVAVAGIGVGPHLMLLR